MRYQNKIFTLITIISLFIGLFIYKFVINTKKQVIKNSYPKKIVERDIYFNFPFIVNKSGIKHYVSNGWEMKRFEINKIGVFRTGISKGDPFSFKKAVIKYFNLKKFPESEKKLYLGKRIMFIKNIPLFSNGVYVIEKKSKRINYIYFFSLKNNFYWFDFSTGNTIENYKKFFDNILVSINSNDKRIKRKLPLKKFSEEIDSICMQSYFILCQSIKIIIIFPLILIIFIFSIVSKVMSFGGKLPDDSFFKGDFPVFKEEKVDYQLIFQFSNKISTGAFVITDKNLYLFSFKKPLFIAPRDGKDYVITEGKSFFGGDYIQIESSNKEYFKRGRTFENILQNKNYKLRIFSSRIDNLKNYLPVKSYYDGK